MSAIETSYSELMSLVGYHAGWDRTVANWKTEQALDGARILRDSLNQFYKPLALDGRLPHEWSFLVLSAALDLRAPYATGTVAIVADAAGSIVTLTSGTWPSWAASGDLWVDGGRYTVKSRTSNSVIRLDDTAVTVAAGETYRLIQHYYDLADDFGSMPSDHFTYRRDQGTGKPSKVIVVGENVIRQRDRQEGLTGWPQLAAILPVAPTTTKSTRWQATFWPLPSADCVLDYRYKAEPHLLDGSTYVYPYGGAAHALTIRASFEDVTYRTVRESEEKRPFFIDRLRQSIQYDRRHNGTHTLGQGVRSLAPRHQTLESALHDPWRHITSSDINLSFG